MVTVGSVISVRHLVLSDIDPPSIDELPALSSLFSFNQLEAPKMQQIDRSS